MENSTIIIGVVVAVLGICIGGVLGYVFSNLSLRSKMVSHEEYDDVYNENAELKTNIKLQEQAQQNLERSMQKLEDEKSAVALKLEESEKIKLNCISSHQILKNKLETQKTEIEQLHNNTLHQFENLANKILENKSNRFTEINKSNISNILEPLNKELSEFKKKVDETYDRESKERFSLTQNITELIKQTDKISDEANNLASALKGQAKKQGDWGEIILERVLEASGFQRDREYTVQESFKSEDGTIKRPDVIVYLPDNRNIVIDSKVSLNAYDRYCASDSVEDQNKYLSEHLAAIYTHIAQLESKKYDEIDSSLDFILMFVPIEPAYLLAIQQDDQLWTRAYKNRIILISPTNLIAVIKLVSDLWNRERQSKNALEIAKQGQTLYDKFINFLDSMEDIGKHINKTQEAYNKATGQLKLGRGNLINQAEKLRGLGIETKKQIPTTMQNYEEDIESLIPGQNIGLLNPKDS